MCNMMKNPYRIGRGPGYQRPPQMSQGRAPVEIMLLLGLAKTRGGRRVKRQRPVEVRHKDGTMNERGKEQTNMMERRKEDVRCQQETK